MRNFSRSALRMRNMEGVDAIKKYRTTIYVKQRLAAALLVIQARRNHSSASVSPTSSHGISDSSAFGLRRSK